MAMVPEITAAVGSGSGSGSGVTGSSSEHAPTPAKRAAVRLHRSTRLLRSILKSPLVIGTRASCPFGARTPPKPLPSGSGGVPGPSLSGKRLTLRSTSRPRRTTSCRRPIGGAVPPPWVNSTSCPMRFLAESLTLVPVKSVRSSTTSSWLRASSKMSGVACPPTASIRRPKRLNSTVASDRSPGIREADVEDVG